jgi:hypothetical protein
MPTLVDNRSGAQLAAAALSSKTDFGASGGVSAAAAVAGGGAQHPRARIASAFADAYNNPVKEAKNYKAQEVRGGSHRRTPRRAGRAPRLRRGTNK